LVEQDHVFYLPGITSPEASAEYLQAKGVPLIGDIGLSNKSFNNPYIWPTRLDNELRTFLEVKNMAQTFGVRKLAKIEAPLPGVSTRTEDDAFAAACQQYGVTCLLPPLQIDTQSVSCDQQINRVIQFQPEFVQLPIPATQYLACLQSSKNQQYFNTGSARGVNPSAGTLKPPGFYGGSGIQAEADQCGDFCNGLVGGGLFLDPASGGYASNFLDGQWNGMQVYNTNMQRYAPNVDPTSLISINYYFAGAIGAQLMYQIMRKNLPVNRENLKNEANNFDFDPGSGAEIHYHDPVKHSAWNCGYVYRMQRVNGQVKWVFPTSKDAKACI
jgi:hypothetical protein